MWQGMGEPLGGSQGLVVLDLENQQVTGDGACFPGSSLVGQEWERRQKDVEERRQASRKAPVRADWPVEEAWDLCSTCFS